MVSFVYGDLWIYNAHAKLLLLSVSVVEKPSITAVSKFFFHPGVTFDSGILPFFLL